MKKIFSHLGRCGLVLLCVVARPAFSNPVFAESPLMQDEEKEPGKGKDKKKKDLPLEQARSLKFTTDEVTWMSLDVSPDGQTIVFDLLGDLYTLPITGGKATRITSGMGYDVQPRFSPDGKQVVFISDSSGTDHVWLYDLEKKERKALTKGKSRYFISPEWTPDGNYIVVSKGDGSVQKLWMLHVDGGAGVQLIKEPERLRTLGAAFNGDGRYIWYAQRTGGWQYNAVFPQYQLARYDRDTGESTVMTSRHGSALRPALSPDGNYLVYATRHDHETGIRIRQMRSGDERWLAYPVQRDDQEALATMDAFPGFAFTPDSKAVVISYDGKIWRVPIDGGEQQNIPFTADVDIALGPEVRFDYDIENTATFTARQIRHAVPSPDGKQVAFTALDRLWTMSLPDGTPKRLTDTDVGEHYPAWSPDGRWIAYSTWADSQGGHLYKMRSNGRGRPLKLTEISGVYSQTAWAPDGKRIVAVRSSARDLQESISFFNGGLASQFIYVPAEGGSGTVIAPTNRRSHPHFNGGSDRIYAHSRADGLVSMRWDGTDVKEHVKVVGTKLPGGRRAPSAGLIIMAPSGDQAIALMGAQLYTVTVPYVGGETPSINVSKPDKASFPAKKLTDIGAQFPAWSVDAKKIYWSIGNALITYDLNDAKVFADSVKAAEKAAEELAESAGDTSATDTSQVAEAEPDEEEKKKKKAKYKPLERRVVISANRDIPQGAVILRGARVITMKADEILENADLVIQNNRIRGVGARGQVEAPGNAQVIDVTGKTIVPGYVDTHAHLRPSRQMHNDQAWQYLANLAYGVTTSRDPQTGSTDVLSYADRVEMGAMIGPRIYSTGPGVFGSEDIKDLDNARNILRRYSDYYDTKTFKMYLSGNRQQRQWLIMAAKELKLMPTTEGGLDFKLNMTHAIDGYSGLEHSLPIYPIYDDIKQLFVLAGITYTPTLLVSYGGPWAENYYYTTERVYEDEKLRRFTPYAELAAKTLRRGGRPGPGGWFHDKEYIFSRHAEFIARLIPAGGRAGIGSHGQLQGLGYHWELWSVHSGGLSNHDALKVATIYGAEAIGLGKQVGSIEPGKLADLVVLNENPLQNIRHSKAIRYVMKNGRLYEGDTLDEVWPVARKLAEPHWRDSEPRTNAGVR